jgi:hypothetical protein
MKCGRSGAEAALSNRPETAKESSGGDNLGEEIRPSRLRKGHGGKFFRGSQPALFMGMDQVRLHGRAITE